MPTLQIRDLPEDMYHKIKKLSEQEHRSLSSQALVLLEQVLSGEQTKKEQRRAIIDELKQGEGNWSEADELPGPEELLAEDRQC